MEDKSTREAIDKAIELRTTLQERFEGLDQALEETILTLEARRRKYERLLREYIGEEEAEGGA